jgi:hypothetical protein
VRVYVDTNCYIDIFENRYDGYIPLAEFSYQVFRRIRERGDILIVSDWLEYELEYNGHLDNYRGFIKDLEKDGVKVVYIKKTAKDKENARCYQNKADALHAILAANSNTDLLVTHNIKDFLEFKDMVKICPPREY